MALRTWRLLQKWRGIRTVLAALLAVAVPTFGVVGTCLVSLLPVIAVNALAPTNETLLTGAVLLGVVLWIAAAALVALGSLRLVGAIFRFRAPRGTVAIGADGIRWRDLWAGRFVPWSAVDTVRLLQRPERTIAIAMRDGSTVELSVADLDGFLDAAREALERFRAREEPGAFPLLRVEGDQRTDLGGWLDRAKQLLVGSYRDASIAPEDLAAIAEDPKAAPEQRIGAALALSQAPEPLRVRVRAAIEDTANPELAEALDEAVAGELRVRTAARAIGERE